MIQTRLGRRLLFAGLALAAAALMSNQTARGQGGGYGGDFKSYSAAYDARYSAYTARTNVTNAQTYTQQQHDTVAPRLIDAWVWAELNREAMGEFNYASVSGWLSQASNDLIAGETKWNLGTIDREQADGSLAVGDACWNAQSWLGARDAYLQASAEYDLPYGEFLDANTKYVSVQTKINNAYAVWP